MKRILLIALLSFGFCSIAGAQSMLGIANSNYAGNAGMNLNPVSMLYMPSQWEIGIVTLNVQAENNYIGIPRQPLSGLAENGSAPHAGLIDNFNSNPKHAGVHFLMKVPSFMMKVNDWAFAYSHAVRTDISVRNVNPMIAKAAWEGLGYAPLHGRTFTAEGLHIAGLSWMESSFSVGKNLTKGDTRRWMVAMTGKYITGIAGGHLSIHSGTASLVNDTTLLLSGLNGSVGYGALSSSRDMTRLKLNGTGADFGISYISNPYIQRFSNGRPVPTKRYDYRVGFSIIDLGFVHFAKNARRYAINTSALNFNDVTEIKVEGREGMDSLMRANFTRGLAPKLKYNIGLPLAASIQYDRCLHPRWYMNLTAVQRLPLPFTHVRRANCLSASIRYETPYFEIAMPYSIYDYYAHRIGLSMRYHFFFIGTDRLGTFYGRDAITGLDVFFGFKVQSIEFLHKKKSGRVVRCATYS